jgi:outer membrane protein OmpA-like peptidoglycan-associated protein
MAQDGPYPVDIELVRPVLSPDAGFAVDSPRVDREGTWLVGGSFQYERSPLRLFIFNDLEGQVVAHRNALYLGANVALPYRFSLGMSLPMGAHLGSNVPDLEADGIGFGDAMVTLRWGAGTWGGVSLGGVATVAMPTGASAKYMGERGVRVRAGLLSHVDLAHLDLVPAELLASVILHARPQVETEFDFTAGSELLIDLGLRKKVLDGRVELLAELVNRFGIALEDFGGRVSSEALVGARYRPSGGFRVDLAVGRGITEGYGTTGFRVMTGVTFVRTPPEPPPEPEFEPLFSVEKLPEEEPEVVEEPEPEEALARVEADEIVLRDPIQFALGTTTILSESFPVVDAVANVLNTDGTIGHMVIEGHASVEGSYPYNYALSVARAKAIYEALVMVGVHPDRMSYRGMGEVVPAREGADEPSLAVNRRVIFHIVRHYAPGEPAPDYASEVRLPWSGTSHRVTHPEPPPAPPQDLLEDEQ